MTGKLGSSSEILRTEEQPKGKSQLQAHRDSKGRMQVGLRFLVTTPRPLLSRMGDTRATSHVVFLILIKQNVRCSSSGIPAIFQVLSSHRRLVMTFPDGADLQHSITTQSSPGQRCSEEGRRGLELDTCGRGQPCGQLNSKSAFWAGRPTRPEHRQPGACSPGRKTQPVRQHQHMPIQELFKSKSSCQKKFKIIIYVKSKDQRAERKGDTKGPERHSWRSGTRFKAHRREQEQSSNPVAPEARPWQRRKSSA